MKTFLGYWLDLLKTQSLLLGALIFGFFVWGAVLIYHAEIEAFPELTNVQVQVITQYPGKAAEEVERRITTPIEVVTAGLSGLIGQRSISIFGLSVVTLTFDDNVSLAQARLNVKQRLSDVELPEDVKAGLNPESTPVGEVFRYSLKGNLPLDEMRLIEDWRLEREFKTIPGVADVVSFGGPARTIDVKLNPDRMKTLGLSVSSVAQALGQNHANAGGGLIAHGDESYVIRSLGLYESPETLEQAAIGTQHNIPIRVRDVGSVQLSHRLRLGQVGVNDSDDVVEGIILLRQGANTLETCRLIREKIEKLNQSEDLKGLQIVTHYDRTDLITRSAHTVIHNILFGIGLVVLLLSIGLGLSYWPLCLSVAVIIPFALLVSFLGVRFAGYVPNLISLGAVDFGIIVETAIFVAEAIIIAVERNRSRDKKVVVAAVSEVLGAALLCALLLLISFIPILSLQRVEGRIFRPLGLTLIFALIGGQLGALLFVPIASFFIPTNAAHEGPVSRVFDSILSKCERIGKRLAALPRLAWTGGVLFAVVISLLSLGLGREFLPALNEGSLYVRATAPSTISLEAAVELAHNVRDRIKKQIPEVIDVISQTGRPDDGTDVNGFDNTETLITLPPMDQWTSASSIDGFMNLAQKALADIDGVEFNFSQPIKDNVDEAISGVKGELVVKVYGQNIVTLQKLADEITRIVKSVPGAQDVAPEQLLGQPELRFQVNRDLMARYGLRVTEAEEVLESALQGKSAAKMIDEHGREIDVLVKPKLPEPVSRDSLAQLPLLTPDGGRVPLSEVTNIHVTEGVARIYREEGGRRIAVKCSVRNRAVVEFVKEASQRIKTELQLPPGYRIQWSGSFENAQRASAQLMIVVPICLLLIMLLLQSYFKSWRLAGLLLWEIPFAISGGLLGLRLVHLNLSISAAAGAIVLIGVSFLTGMMLLKDWTETSDAWKSMREKGRSILISGGVAIIGLIPAAFSHGIGSETARPFAVCILGGLITSLLFTLVLFPALLSRQPSSPKD